jgi:hypothetical protein
VAGTRDRGEPRLVTLPATTMAVVTTRGDPNVVGGEAMKALYGAVYRLKFVLKKRGAEFKVSPLRARWPDAHLGPKEEWTGIWGLPLPDGTDAVEPKEPGIAVNVEVWEYGDVAEILHVGPFSEETPTIERLHRFIEEQGYAIAGLHEEEYLTRLDAPRQRTIIRYPVRPR